MDSKSLVSVLCLSLINLSLCQNTTTSEPLPTYVCGFPESDTNITDVTSGMIHSLFWPDEYPYYHLCQVIIKTTDPNHRISLLFTHFQLEDCGNCRTCDYISIYDGDSVYHDELGVFCGFDLPDPIISSRNSILLFFKTDAGIEYSGWRAIFQTVTS